MASSPDVVEGFLASHEGPTLRAYRADLASWARWWSKCSPRIVMAEAIGARSAVFSGYPLPALTGRRRPARRRLKHRQIAQYLDSGWIVERRETSSSRPIPLGLAGATVRCGSVGTLATATAGRTALASPAAL